MSIVKTILVVLLIWTLVSIPVGIFVGRFIRAEQR